MGVPVHISEKRNMATRIQKIDRFAEIDREIKKLETEKEPLKASILKFGKGSHQGSDGVSVTVYEQCAADTFDVMTLKASVPAKKLWNLLQASASAVKTAVKAGVITAEVAEAAKTPGKPGLRAKVIRA